MCNPTHEALERANEQLASVRLTLQSLRTGGGRLHPLHRPYVEAALAKVHEAEAHVYWLSNGVREFGEAKDDDCYTI